MKNYTTVYMDEEQGGEVTPTGGNEGELPSWYYTAPTDDSAGVGGNGEVPDWLMVDKYKSMEEQAKAYPEAAKKLGGFVGAPETYEMPEGMEEGTLDAGMVDIVKEIGKEFNMGQGMFNELLSKVNEYQSGQQEEATAQQMEALGENGEQRINAVNNWLNTNAPKEVIEMIMPMATSAESIKALEFFIDKSKGSKVADQTTQPTEKMGQAEYATLLMAKDGYGNLKMSTDPEYKAKMDKLTGEMQVG